MLREPDRVIRHVREWMFQDPAVIPASWEQIVPEAGRTSARDNALRLVHLGNEGGLGPTLSVTNLLDIIRYGLAPEMVRPLLDEGASEELEREMAGRLVTGFLTAAAIEAGSASYRFSWAAPRQLVDEHGAADDLTLLVDAALADVEQVPALELWLQAHRVDRELELGAVLAQGVPKPQQGVPAEGSDDDDGEAPNEVPDEEPSADARASMAPANRTASV